jgi:hypothetical protein
LISRDQRTRGQEQRRGLVPRRRSTKWLIKLHSITGLSAIASIIVLVLTGWALNHGDDLELYTTYIKNNWILDLYHVSEKPEVGEFLSQGTVVSVIDDTVYLGSDFLYRSSDAVIGITLFDNVVYIFSSSAVRLYSLRGEHIETATLTERVSAVGSSLVGEVVPLKSAAGSILGLSIDSLELGSEAVKEISVLSEQDWQQISIRQQLSHPLIIQDWRGRLITVEQAMLDIHSGRLFGSLGVWLVDLFGLLLLFLALTGPVIWFRRKRRRSGSANRSPT